MVRVDAYIGPLTHSRGEGRAAYACHLEYLASNGKTYVRDKDGILPMATKNRADLMAALMALKMIKFKPGYEVVIHTDSEYLKRIDNDIDKYKEREWKTASGKEMKNSDLWMIYYMQHEVHWIDIKIEQTGMESWLEEVYERNGH